MTPAYEHSIPSRPPLGDSIPSRLQVRLAGIEASIRAVEQRLANVEVVLASRLDGDDLTLAELAIIARSRLISTLGGGLASDNSPAQQPLAGETGIGEADTHNL